MMVTTHSDAWKLAACTICTICTICTVCTICTDVTVEPATAIVKCRWYTLIMHATGSFELSDYFHFIRQDIFLFTNFLEFCSYFMQRCWYTLHGNLKHKPFCILVLIFMKTSFLCKTSKQAPGPTQPPIHKGEINLSPPSSAEVKNECSYILLPQYEFTAWTGKTSASFRFVIRRPTVNSLTPF